MRMNRDDPMPMTPEDVIQNLGDLPPLPQVATRAIQISVDSDTSSGDLQNLIKTDQALSGQLLRIANSALFGRMREVTTLTEAIMTLGFSTARSVVIAASVKNLLSRGTAGFQERLLWEHALVTAITGSAFSKAMRFAHAEEVFLAGLMHDIGKSVLTHKFPEAYGTLLRRVHDRGGDGLSLELDTFGFDHAMVGGALLASWNLSASIQAAARWHHDPAQAPPEHRQLVALVALGHRTALDLGIGLGDPDLLVKATCEALDILLLDTETHQKHRAKALEPVVTRCVITVATEATIDQTDERSLSTP
jgi:putative nucleotidyltransferase with HDIG domain